MANGLFLALTCRFVQLVYNVSYSAIGRRVCSSCDRHARHVWSALNGNVSSFIPVKTRRGNPRHPSGLITQWPKNLKRKRHTIRLYRTRTININKQFIRQTRNCQWMNWCCLRQLKWMNRFEMTETVVFRAFHLLSSDEEPITFTKSHFIWSAFAYELIFAYEQHLKRIDEQHARWNRISAFINIYGCCLVYWMRGEVLTISCVGEELKSTVCICNWYGTRIPNVDDRNTDAANWIALRWFLICYMFVPYDQA